jgi:RNA polymerase sigma-70 factor (ECF subfamily)
MIKEADFAAIIEDTKKVVLSAVSRTLPQDYYHAIDDVVQETYLRAYNSLVAGKFREESALTTWLYTIARNESLRMIKKLKREEKKREKAAEKQKVTMAKSIDKEQQPDLSPYIADLPEVQRAVMELYLTGHSEKDIAGKLEIAQGTVKSRLSRARESLRTMIKEGTYD